MEKNNLKLQEKLKPEPQVTPRGIAIFFIKMLALFGITHYIMVI